MDNVKHIDISTPPFLTNAKSAWHRHFTVYTRHLLSNGLPPFIEPLFFLAGVGLGLGHYVGLIEGTPYIKFLAAGLMTPPAMYTASFECTFGTFIRLEFDKVYDGMISVLSVNNIFVGEIFFAGTKGLFFSSSVLIVLTLFGLIASPWAILIPLVGFLTGIMFASLALFVTSFVKTINHFNFYFTGLLTPMFFFSGIVFPLTNLPKFAQVIAEFFPLTHAANIMRALCLNKMSYHNIWDLIYMLIFTVVFATLGIKRIKKRIII